MKPEDCPRLDQCSNLKMILDKDLLDFQYAEAIRVVCAHCSEAQSGDRDKSRGQPKDGRSGEAGYYPASHS